MEIQEAKQFYFRGDYASAFVAFGDLARRGSEEACQFLSAMYASGHCPVSGGRNGVMAAYWAKKARQLGRCTSLDTGD